MNYHNIKHDDMNRCDECKHRHDCICVPYGCESFEIDIEEHDKQIRAEVLKEVECAMYHQAFNIDHELDGLQKWDSGNWIRYKLFENVMEQLKGE